MTDEFTELEAGGATVGEAVRILARRFFASGEGARAEARLLVSHVLSLDLTGLVVGADRPVSAEDGRRLTALARRRLQGEPVQRLVGTASFWGLDFELSAETLVPRPDTETLVEAVSSRLARVVAPRIADIGVGSGAILVSLLHERGDATGVGVDISEDALATARKNAERNGVGGRAVFVRGSWAEPLAGDFDAIVSNPPYIATDVIAGLDTEVRLHDPAAALDGGADGLVAYRALAATVGERLKPGGLVAFEIGFDQADAVSALLAAAGFVGTEVIRDLAGRDRVVLAHRPGPTMENPSAS